VPIMKDKIVEQIDSKLRQKYGEEIREIILYGSRARGDNQEDSDYDFVILCENEKKKIKEYSRKISNEILIDCFAVVSIVVLTSDEYEKRIYEPYLMNVKREGVLV
jgi:predicted nucleotidyltransferase